MKKSEAVKAIKKWLLDLEYQKGSRSAAFEHLQSHPDNVINFVSIKLGAVLNWEPENEAT